MNETSSSYYRRPRTSDALQPDLSRIPAYVEPPRPFQAKPDKTPWLSIVAIFGGTSLVAAGFLGIHLYGSRLFETDHPALERTADIMPPLQPPFRPKDVPLPSGVEFPPAITPQHPPPPPVPAVHATRLTRPSNGYAGSL